MNRRRRRAVLAKAFRALDPEWQERLMWHVKKGTRIFCGPGADKEWLSPEGYG